ncbi:MAG: hypothetical protein JNM80_10670 [Phycisphaerae bacterium]|nr:hypothetical protein [Phycisphaerae bacterium]
MSQPARAQLPYYEEYVEQILRPRVAKIAEEVRATLAEQVWREIVGRLASDQRSGIAPTPEAIEQVRLVLADTLGMRVAAELQVTFGASASAPAAPASPPMARQEPVPPAGGHDVVDRGGFLDNPLARAVGGVRRLAR